MGPVLGLQLVMIRDSLVSLVNAAAASEKTRVQFHLGTVGGHGPFLKFGKKPGKPSAVLLFRPQEGGSGYEEVEMPVEQGVDEFLKACGLAG